MKKAAFAREPKRVSPRRKKGHEYLWLGVMTALLVVPMLVIAGKQRNLVQMGYEVSSLRQDNTHLMEDQIRLRAELARLRAPDRIVAASMKLGLRPVPVENRFLVSVGIPPREEQPAAPVDETLVAALAQRR